MQEPTAALLGEVNYKASTFAILTPPKATPDQHLTSFEDYYQGMFQRHIKAHEEFAATREYRKGLKRTWEEANELYENKRAELLKCLDSDSE